MMRTETYLLVAHIAEHIARHERLLADCTVSHSHESALIDGWVAHSDESDWFGGVSVAPLVARANGASSIREHADTFRILVSDEAARVALYPPQRHDYPEFPVAKREYATAGLDVAGMLDWIGGFEYTLDVESCEPVPSLR
ncbi:hypothetical protein BISA_1387 [Bifidobacterium saguini DSM 23967]|uniref:Uncharacterized protein n=1 Tax=Bifidobacterium saguini DSM 23967 TaxID=1437607 RepID=A0A087DCH1_9BIFI|nr:hypothetical protein [Bifidobacterium saguini]KFI93221.1 hypothetical protein BISA_1387 [Bifidobacterium saguini DSM 23967]